MILKGFIRDCFEIIFPEFMMISQGYLLFYKFRRFQVIKTLKGLVSKT
jgi:hypothetical protein